MFKVNVQSKEEALRKLTLASEGMFKLFNNISSEYLDVSDPSKFEEMAEIWYQSNGKNRGYISQIFNQ